MPYIINHNIKVSGVLLRVGCMWDVGCCNPKLSSFLAKIGEMARNFSFLCFVPLLYFFCEGEACDDDVSKSKRLF